MHYSNLFTDNDVLTDMLYKLIDNKTTDQEYIALLDFFITFSMTKEGSTVLFVQKVLFKLSKLEIFNNLEQMSYY